jgi:hypothetical protein
MPMMTLTDAQRWVALMTFVDDYADAFYEAGGVYDHHPQCRFTEGARPLLPNERLVQCPRCGQQFADVDDGTAEENRDLHFDGDADIPSICRQLPARQLRVIAGEDVR